MKAIIVLFCLIGLLWSPVYAQRGGAENSYHFSAVSWRESIQDLFYLHRGEYIPLSIPNGSPSPLLEYSGPARMEFFKRRVDPEGEVSYTPTTFVNLRGNSGRYLLLFVPGGASGTHRIIPILDDVEQFHSSAFNFYNLSSSRIAARIGNEDFIIEPANNHIVNIENNGSQNVNIEIASGDAQEDNWKMLYRSRWGAPGQRRIWVFLHGEGERNVQIKRYYQVLPPNT